MNKQNNQSDEKKKVILSILAVIVLVLMVIGVSYAVTVQKKIKSVLELLHSHTVKVQLQLI